MKNHMIINTYKMAFSMNPMLLISDRVRQVASLVWVLVSDSSVYNVIWECNSTHKLQSPKKTRLLKTIGNSIDFTKNVICKKIHAFFV